MSSSDISAFASNLIVQLPSRYEASSERIAHSPLTQYVTGKFAMRLMLRSLILGYIVFLPGNPQAQATPLVQGFSVDTSWPPPFSGPVIDPVDRQGIVAAIQAGNRPGLLAIRASLAQNTPQSVIDRYMITLADAGLARINGDYRASNAALDRGLRIVGHHADTSQELNALLFLNESLRYGNLFLSGDLSGWIERTAWLERVYFAPIRAFYKLPNLQFPNLTLLTPRVPVSSITNPSAVASDDEQLPLRVTSDVTDGRHAIDVEVQATLFNTKSWIILDTGCPEGVIPTSYVARHHLPIVIKSNRGSDGFRHNISTDYVIVPEIRLGQTVLKNQLFSVAPIPYMVLGLSQLGQLRHLTIDKHMVRFGPRAPFDCREPLRMTSIMAGTEARLIFPYALNGLNGVATLDTGDNASSVLSVRTKTLPPNLVADAKMKSLTTVAGKVSYLTVTAPATVTVSGFTVSDLVRYTQSPMPDILIPTGILNRTRFSLDMTERVACLTPYPARGPSL